jgi:hypothetical protein
MIEEIKKIATDIFSFAEKHEGELNNYELSSIGQIKYHTEKLVEALSDSKRKPYHGSDDDD